MQAFIRREDIGERYDDDPVLIRLNTSPANGNGPSRSTTPQAPAVPRPEKWEPDWSPDEDATMRRWAGNGGGPLPDCYQSNVKHMLAAIEREKKRRRDIGDIASVEQYELRKEDILKACADREADLRRMRETAMTKAPGFWAFLPPKLGELNQAFLRGDLPRDSSGVSDDRGERASQWRESWRTEGFR